MPKHYHVVDEIDSSPTAARDLTMLFIGQLIGSGQNRNVYNCVQDPTCVIKHEPDGDEFQNVLEWRIWEAVKAYKEMAKWFAPCVALSGNGQFLIQKKITVLPRAKYPKKLPDWFGDTKYVNFGTYAGRFVACDYGYPSLCRLMWAQRRLTKAKWWSKDNG